jgi:hypothetical protein
MIASPEDRAGAWHSAAHQMRDRVAIASVEDLERLFRLE